jgi:hypothetical protein
VANIDLVEQWRWQAGLLDEEPPGENGTDLRGNRFGDPLPIHGVQSTTFDDPLRSPQSTAVFDSALIMRNIPHCRHAATDL